jgi:AcrR family transcriptional regulator
MSATLASAMEAPRRHLTERQVELVQRLVEAAAEEVEEHGYAPITVRSIAKRAGVATATAYTYFSSKDHLLSEVLWRRMQALPAPLVDLDRPASERVADVVSEMSLGTVDRPDLVAACTTAMLAPGPDVQRVRSQIGAEIHHRLQAALGNGGDPAVLRVLETTYIGAMLSAGLGHIDFSELPDRLAEAAALLTRQSSTTTGPPRRTSPQAARSGR